MVEYERGNEHPDADGCLLAVELMVNKEGELTQDEMEQLDQQMSKLGSERTGRRIGVNSTDMKDTARVKYVYQERLTSWSMKNLIERVEAFTDFDDATAFIGTEVVEFR